jgi:hypothetical protein
MTTLQRGRQSTVAAKIPVLAGGHIGEDVHRGGWMVPQVADVMLQYDMNPRAHPCRTSIRCAWRLKCAADHLVRKTVHGL